MTTLLFSHPVFQRHEVPPGHVEHAGRYAAVEQALKAEEFAALERRLPPLATPAQIELVHTEQYRLTIEEAAPEAGLAQLDADTFMGPSSLEAALRAVGGACAAVDAVFAGETASGEAANAFVASRPPGHHAEPQRAMGFCLFNTAAIAAIHARTHLAKLGGAKRVAVLDFDVHHGNGTQAAFWDDENAFYASSHEWPQYPGTGRVEDRGAFDNIINAPLATGEGSEAFRRAWGEILLPALSDFDPDCVIISAGFDAHHADPVGRLKLDEADFSWVTAEIAAIAKDKAGGRLVSVLEGGYDLAALAASAAAHVKALIAA